MFIILWSSHQLMFLCNLRLWFSFVNRDHNDANLTLVLLHVTF
ncbi:hypothetical protein SLEP1_g36821 [Rubroshorea leprosula]|uniref:Uncharacterized protein n=1 Tax=Rubroshorea leprosula TaxID=152421 RepID=A0AAV5KT91_9ROSI|nr:hypothetical protein SLEP1_g36821 [Rubroshorea leprosula]